MVVVLQKAPKATASNGSAHPFATVRRSHQVRCSAWQGGVIVVSVPQGCGSGLSLGVRLKAQYQPGVRAAIYQPHGTVGDLPINDNVALSDACHRPNLVG
jgi:hypothetical protein